jgi:hypothetical protein
MDKATCFLLISLLAYFLTRNEEVTSLETLVDIYWTTSCYILEEVLFKLKLISTDLIV